MEDQVQEQKKAKSLSKRQRELLSSVLIACGTNAESKESILRRLDALIRKWSGRIGEDPAQLAIYRVHWANNVMRLAHDLKDYLDGSGDQPFDRDLRKGLRLYGGGDLWSTQLALETLAMGAELAHCRGKKHVRQSMIEGDVALREFCAAVAQEWENATGQKLPDSGDWRGDERWRAVHSTSPLEIMLDAIGIRVGQTATEVLRQIADNRRQG